MTEFLVGNADLKDKCPITSCPRVFRNRKELCGHCMDLHKISVCDTCEEILQFQNAMAYERHKQKRHPNPIIFIDIEDIIDDCDYSQQQQPLNDDSREQLVKAEPVDVESGPDEEPNVGEEKEDEECQLNEELDQNKKQNEEKIRQTCGFCKKEFSRLSSHVKVCKKSHQDEDDNETRSESSSDTVFAKISSSNKRKSADSGDKPKSITSGAGDYRGLPCVGTSRSASHNQVNKIHGAPNNSNTSTKSDQPPVLDRFSPVHIESASTKRRSPSAHESVQDVRKIAKMQPQPMTDDVEEGEEDYELTCNDCGEACKSKSELMAHLLIHNKQKATAESEKLKIIRQHSLSCPICSMQFVERPDLLKHLSSSEHPDIDDPEMAYKCQYSLCEETFMNAFELYVHFRTHQVPDHHEISLSPFSTSNKRDEIWKWIEDTNNSHPYLLNDNNENDSLIPEEKPRRERSRHSSTVCSEGGLVGCREDGCQESFPTVHELKVHRLAMHPDSKIIHCSYPHCDVPFSKTYLKRHIKECHQVSSEN